MNKLDYFIHWQEHDLLILRLRMGAWEVLSGRWEATVQPRGQWTSVGTVFDWAPLMELKYQSEVLGTSTCHGVLELMERLSSQTLIERYEKMQRARTKPDAVVYALRENAASVLRGFAGTL